MSKGYQCTACGAFSLHWVGQTCSCGASYTWALADVPRENVKPLTAREAGPTTTTRLWVGKLLGKVLGGGAVLPSTVLLSGCAGSGKSTLALQALAFARSKGVSTCYITSEQAHAAVATTARRIGAEDVPILEEDDFEAVETFLLDKTDSLVVVDSVQQLWDARVGGMPGSATQLRAIVGRVSTLATEQKLAVLVLSQVNSDGDAAGGPYAGHECDVVVRLECPDGTQSTARTLMTEKNRFYSTASVKCELTATGLVHSVDDEDIEERKRFVAARTVPIALEEIDAMLRTIQEWRKRIVATLQPAEDK